ncbi:MAG: copper amine oxidase N-terminal domain-containing protein [Dethiobacteria bacterium]|jgi:hypothetical protein
MKRSTKKVLTVLCLAFFVLSLAIPAFAASENSVNKVPQVSKDDKFEDKDTAPFLRIREKNIGDFSNGDYFELALTNASWLKDKITAEGAVDVANATVEVDYISKKILGITVNNISGSDNVEIRVPMLTEITEEGEAKVTVDPRDSAVTGGTYVFAVSAEGKTISSIEKVNKFGGRYGSLATLRIDETRIGALGNKEQTIKLKLPPKYSWDGTDGVVIEPKGGLAGAYGAYDLDIEGENKRTLTFKFDPTGKVGGARGSIFISGLKIAADRDASYGDVVLDIDGDKVTATELLVAKRMDYGVEASVKEVKELVAGMWDQKTAKITIEETLEKSLIAGREIAVILPEWVKIVPNEDGEVTITGDAEKGEVGSRQNELFIKVEEKDSGKIKYEFELLLSIEADKSGDIVAEFSGASMERQEVVIAEAVPPITAEVAATDLKIGVQDQPAPDIIITETAKARIDDQFEHYSGGLSRDLTVTLPKGIEFASTPDVDVTEGNLEIGKVRLSDDKRELIIPVDSSSTRTSTLKISDVKLTLDRTVPEGEFKAAIGGDVLVKNDEPRATIKTPVYFDTDYVVEFVFANVITPAPGEVRSTSVFTIGSTTYTVVEDNKTVEKTMDVAPYIKGDRTFLPLRFVAYALGVNEENIIWDPVTRAVTVFKDGRIAQVTIGSQIMLVNGVSISMDVAPEITEGRTMLPIRWLGQALGATIDWDPDTRQVTVSQ